jgi:Fic family protein
MPGEIRCCEVEVGRHIPPGFRSPKDFLARFAQGYRRDQFDPIEWIIAAAASHHRLAWIHPFLDGNGRVTRLFTHAFFIQAKSDGHLLWMVSRGLARTRHINASAPRSKSTKAGRTLLTAPEVKGN